MTVCVCVNIGMELLGDEVHHNYVYYTYFNYI